MSIWNRLFGRRTDCNRGTITILRDGQFIVGLPLGTTDRVADEVAKGAEGWVSKGVGSAVLPFPVDVMDLRP